MLEEHGGSNGGSPASPLSDRDVAAYWDGNAPAWTALVRAGYDVWRDEVNTPAFVALLPEVAGLIGLDIGCGEGATTRTVARLGATMTGIDISMDFIERASEQESREPLGIRYRVASAHSMPFGDDCFDFATAFMSLMDMPDLAAALQEAHRILRSDGFLQFSILHPCFFPPGRKLIENEDGRVVAVQISGYFEPAEFVEEWTFRAPADELAAWAPFRIPFFHRTLSDYLNTLTDTGFAIERVAEPRPGDDAVRRHPRLQPLQVFPNLLHVRARKSGDAKSGR